MSPLMTRAFSRYTEPGPILSAILAYAPVNSLPLVAPKPFEPPPWQQLPHITQQRLPDKPTDIRGMDSAGHSYMNRRNMFRNFPTVTQNKFFTLKFFPKNHHLCTIRKSNVAFTFSNSGSAVLNDSKLLQMFSAYKGKYAKIDFFKSLPIPCGTAASRDKNRKMVKRTLHKALHEVIGSAPVSKVSGIFYFKFHDYAVTEEQKTLLRAQMTAAVAKVCHDVRLEQMIMKAVQVQNQIGSHDSLLEGVRLENTLGAQSEPGYFPKLPYLRRRGKRSGLKRKRRDA